MADWRPYLEELIADDREASEKVKGLLRLTGMLGSPLLQAPQRVRLLDVVAELDTSLQVFMLPWLLDLLRDPSLTVRHRMLRLASELLGGTAPRVIGALGKMVDGEGQPGLDVRPILDALDSQVGDEPPFDLQTPFPALVYLRRPIFTAAALLAFTRYLSAHRDRERLLSELRGYLEHDERRPLQRRLLQWMRGGPLLLRYLLVTWIGASGVALASEETAAETLFKIYRQDADPLVTGAAVEAYAQCIDTPQLDEAVRRLAREQAAFVMRHLEWAGRPPADAIRTVSISLLKAVGNLAERHFPAPAPLDRLGTALSTPANVHLDLLRPDSPLSPAERLKVFRAAMLVHPRVMRVRVGRTGDAGAYAFVAGDGRRLRVSDSDAIAATNPAERSFWAQAALDPTDRGTDPTSWTFQLRDTGNRLGATDLGSVFSPALAALLDGQEGRASMRAKLESQVDRNGEWMLGASETVTKVLDRAMVGGGSLSSPAVEPLLRFLIDLAVGAGVLRGGERDHPLQSRLRRQIKSVLLNHFARQEVFDLWFPGGAEPELDANALTDLASAAMRSRPGESASFWITGNWETLKRIAVGSADVKTRSTAAMVLRYFPRQDELQAPDLTGLQLPPEEVYQRYGQALCWVDDQALARLQQRYLPGDRFQELPADGPLQLVRKRQLCAEVLARALERGEGSSPLAEDMAAALLATSLADPRAWGMTRLRLLAALAEYGNALAANVRRLQAYLLRTSSSTELQRFLDLRVRNRGSLDGPLLVKLVESVRADQPQVAASLTSGLDQLGVADMLARRQLILRSLARELQHQGEPLYRFYMQQAESDLPPPERSEAVAAAGEVLRVTAAAGDVGPHELLAVLRPAYREGEPIAAAAVDVAPSFVHHTRDQEPLRCLASFRQVPKGALDFHFLPGPAAARQALLLERLESGAPLRLLARVAEALPGDWVCLDLGVSLPGGGSEAVFSIAPPPLEDDVVVLDVYLGAATEGDLAGIDLTLWQGSAEQPLHAFDLRRDDAAVETLRRLWQRRGRGRLLLQATIKLCRPPIGGRMQCLLLTGFEWLRQDDSRQLPTVMLAEADGALPAGSSVTVEVHRLQWRMPAGGPARQVEIGLHRERPVVPGRAAFGRLRSVRRPNGRRSWFGEVDGVDLPVHRATLTGDLRKLFALDNLADGAAALSRLAEAACLLQCVDDGQRFSVVDAPPRWRAHDLLIAVLAAKVDSIVLLRRDGMRSDRMIFEVCPTAVADSRGGSELLPLGVLAEVAEGEIFDPRNVPLAPGSVSPGVRLRLRVEYGRLDSAGRLVAAGPGAAEDPYLRMTAEPDGTDTHFRDLLAREALVRVRVRRRAGRAEAELAETLPDGFPAPQIDIEIEQGGGGLRDDWAELDAVVRSDWRPESEDYALSVAVEPTVAIPLPFRTRNETILRMLKLDQGSRLPWNRFVHSSGKLACLASGLHLQVDPLLPYLLPQPMNAAELDSLGRQLQIRLTKVDLREQRYVLDDQTAAEILDGAAGAIGLVVRTPGRAAKSKSVGVCWLHTAADSDEIVPQSGPERAFDPRGFMPRNGDRLLIERGRGGFVLLQKRSFTASILYAAQRLEEWADRPEAAAQQPLLATVLQYPEEPYLFSFAPASLVEVGADQLLERERLKDAFALDRVELTVIGAGDPSTPKRLLVQKVHPGPLRTHLGRPFDLQVHYYHRDTALFTCSLRGRGEMERYGALPLALAARQLPPNAGGARLATQLARRSEDLVFECTLSRFFLEVRQVRDVGETAPCYTFELTPVLAAMDRGPVAAMQRPLLVEALEETARLETVGRVVALGDGVGIELPHYRHDAPLPLPPFEQTWLRHTGALVPRGWQGPVVVVRDVERGIFASLRRLRPYSLESWLGSILRGHSAGVVQPHHLLYCGVLDAGDVAECGLNDLADGAGDDLVDGAVQPDAAGDRPWVLFEAAPGEAVVARVEQLWFWGRVFDPRSLQRGDRIVRFKLVPPATADGEPGMDILQVQPDIAYEIEHFDREQGIFFGKVAGPSGQPAQLTELRGVGYRDQAATSRLGRWRLRLEPGTVLEAAADPATDLHYLKWSRTDRDRGELFFRLATQGEVFRKDNLIFVQATGEREHAATTTRLKVQPLSGLRGVACFIPDTQYSERLGRLERSARAQGGIFLARVERFDERGRDGQVIVLSLTRTPHRPYGLLMERDEWQAIVKRGARTQPQGAHELHLEVDEGVNVYLPLDYVDGDTQQDFRPGDVLLLRPQPDRFRVRLVDVVPSHLRYLDPEQHPTVLTLLWGTAETRQRTLTMGRDLNCNLIGLAQVRAVCKVSPQSVDAVLPLAQIVDGADASWVRLHEAVGSGATVGRLVLEADRQPQLRSLAGELWRLPWSQVTCREGDAASLIRQLQTLTWRHKAPLRRQEPAAMLATAEVVADRLGTDTVSLVSRRARPFPVDHLIDQFLPPRDEGVHGAVERTFPVAAAKAGSVVLELAPGTFAELPSSLLRPLLQGQLRPGCELSCAEMAAGDLLTLEWRPPHQADREDFLSPLQLVRLVAGHGRQAEHPLVAEAHRAVSGGWQICAAGAPGMSLDRFTGTLDDQVVDLEQFPLPWRSRRLVELARRFGSNLVLVGRVAGLNQVPGGCWHRIAIGLDVPSAGDRGDPVEFRAGVAPLPQGALRHVRVLQVRAARDGGAIGEFKYHAEDPAGRTLVRCEGGRCRRFFQPPRPGDVVFAHRPASGDDGELRVLGYEALQPVWEPDSRDPLQLHHDVRRRALLCHLDSLTAKGLWVTVERVELKWIFLSRRLQLDRVLPPPGKVARCRVRACLDAQSLLVELLGVPHVLNGADLVHGRCRLRDFAAGMTQDQQGLGREIEVVLKPSGQLSALDVYRPPQLGAESEATVEQVAAAGLIAIVQGSRVFVPARELSWCNLDADQLCRIFRAGTTLRLALPLKPDQEPISHVRIQDIRTEIAAMLRSRDGVYVSVQSADHERGRAIVRGRSGVLMELAFDAGSRLEHRLLAYVVYVDSSTQRIVLSREDTPPPIWQLPAAADPAFAVDRLTREVVRQSLERLRAAAAVRDAAVVDAWAGEQVALEPSPANLRLMLEHLRATGRGPSPWWRSEADPAAAASPLQRTWRELSRLLAEVGQRGVQPQPAGPAARFAAAYWLLLEEDPAPALVLVEAASTDPQTGACFDVGLTRARALFDLARFKAATAVLRTLTSRLWASALVTLPLPLLRADPLDPGDGRETEWSGALAGGQLEKLSQLLADQRAGTRRSSAGLASQVWLAIAQRRLGGSFDRLVDEFFEALNEDRRDGLVGDRRAYLVASYLCFARGEIGDAWRYLDLAPSPAGSGPDAAVAFWRRCLGAPPAELAHQGADPLLAALRGISRRLRWRDVDAASFHQLWEAFRRSQHRWYLHIAACRALPQPPQDLQELERWVVQHAAESARPYLLDSRTLGEVEERVEIDS